MGRCVAITADGGQVVFESDHGTVRVSEKEGGVWKTCAVLESNTGVPLPIALNGFFGCRYVWTAGE